MSCNQNHQETARVPQGDLPRRAIVIGNGGWGTALALLLHGNGMEVTVWGALPSEVAHIQEKRENSDYLPGIALPEGLAFTADPAAAERAGLVVLASPSRYYHDVLLRCAPYIDPSALCVSVTKGLDAASHCRMTTLAENILGHGPVASLSGPSFAEEVARGLPTAVVVASPDPGRARIIQRLFSSDTFRVYTSDDVTGVELGGALKNIMAIAAGVSDGLGFGYNSRAALITRGLAEMTRLGQVLGARADTFAGLSGLGDLILTCTGPLSRNRHVGERIGRGETVDAILSSMKQVAEGVINCRNALELARETGCEVPIIEQVHAVLYEGLDPFLAVRSLLDRELKAE